jgi:SAM-dependent methyltransferase
LTDFSSMTPTTVRTGSAEHWGPLWGARPDRWAHIEEQETPTYEHALRHLTVKPGDRVLDIGCGTGVFLGLAAQNGARVAGLDASESLLRVAQSRVPEADLRLGDMEFLPWEDNSFDVVTGFNSFFYAADMVAALREAGRVAKPGAPVVIQVWGRPENCDLESLKRALRTFLPAPKQNGPPPKLWEPGVLETMAETAGLAPEARLETRWAFEFPDIDVMVRMNLAPGIVVQAVQNAGEEAVAAAITEALAPYAGADGRCRLQNEWHYLIARAS